MPKVEMYKNDPKILDDKKFKEDLKKGVPSELRGLFWQKIVGNELRITQKLFDVLLERAKICE